MRSAQQGKALVVGGGLAGCLAALYLARSGWRVELYERHGDPRREDVAGPSMNLGLSRRGLRALAGVGLDGKMLERAIPMTGRVIHHLDGSSVHQPYGGRPGQVINAIKRGDINALLLDELDRTPAVEVRFHHRCTGLDRETATLRFRTSDGDERRATGDFVVGADGLFSAVRRAMQRGLRAEYRQEFLDWGWKELNIPAGEGGAFRLRREAFHLWPRGGSMVFAHPNLDGSFTCSFVLPFEGDPSFASLGEPAAVERLFEERFPDLPPLIPNLAEQFLANPTVSLASVRTRPWSWRDRVVLIGDAAHAVVPFMAQGMNAAFEDCRALAARLDEFPDRAAAFRAFEADRKPHTDALEEMSRANFIELRDRVRSPWTRFHKKVDTVLSRWLGEAWMPLHGRVTHTTQPYAEARRSCRRQDRLLAGTAALAAGGLLAALLGRR